MEARLASLTERGAKLLNEIDKLKIRRDSLPKDRRRTAVGRRKHTRRKNAGRNLEHARERLLAFQG